MFSYYGSKSKIVNKYPTPKYDLIIEPFCGSARYACKYGLERDVWINDMYHVIPGIWRWIQNASLKDLMSLPELEKGGDLRRVKSISGVERDLLGFCMHRGLEYPQHIYSGWACRGNEIKRMKNRFKDLIGNISHWKITCKSYKKVDSETDATWFIDPPYQTRRRDYIVCNPDGFYDHLSDYCTEKSGQVIVCEMLGAKWLPFKPLDLNPSSGQRRTTYEVIWTND